ncbi:hypothetical protein B0H14DRAFT_577878 [Mycena olivaceomarginata]|nr:hypothetical protein B0H14DRAFT_577878 [Mycena olivaceomarginata]
MDMDVPRANGRAVQRPPEGTQIRQAFKGSGTVMEGPRALRRAMPRRTRTSLRTSHEACVREGCSTSVAARVEDTEQFNFVSTLSNCPHLSSVASPRRYLALFVSDTLQSISGQKWLVLPHLLQRRRELKKRELSGKISADLCLLGTLSTWHSLPHLNIELGSKSSSWLSPPPSSSPAIAQRSLNCLHHDTRACLAPLFLQVVSARPLPIPPSDTSTSSEAFSPLWSLRIRIGHKPPHLEHRFIRSSNGRSRNFLPDIQVFLWTSRLDMLCISVLRIALLEIRSARIFLTTAGPRNSPNLT